MTPNEPARSPAADLHQASRRRARRVALGVAIGVLVAAGVAGALVLRDDGGDTMGTSAPTTAAPEDDPVSCLHGTYRLVSQEYRAPVSTAYGWLQLEGGEAGRTIELLPDSTFRFTDTGAAETRFTVVDTESTGSATLVVEATGTYTATPETITIEVTSLSGTLTAVTDDGETLDVPLPPDGEGVERTFGLTPNAAYTCDGDTVTVEFGVLTIVMERAPTRS